VGCSSSAEDKPSASVFSARPGVDAPLVTGVSKVDGVEPTATQTSHVMANYQQDN